MNPPRSKYNPTAMSKKLTLLCAKVGRIGDICKEIKGKMVLPSQTTPFSSQ